VRPGRPALLDIFEPAHLSVGLPPPPPTELDPYLDAASTCFARHGILRTRIPDLARELGVSRTTVYRQIGSIDSAARMLLARELHRLLGRLPDLAHSTRGPDPLSGLLVAIVRSAREHPVLTKVLTDEPELIGPLLVSSLADLCGRAATIAVPLLDQAMAAGWIARQDAPTLCEALVRLIVTMIVAPPEHEAQLQAVLSAFVAPGAGA
jgi:AcrR family transcriptional regulator